MKLFKSALMINKGIILTSLVMASRTMVHQKPTMEQGILYSLPILIDLLMIFWIGHNEDWIFVIVVTAVGLVVFLNTFRIKLWFKTIYKGNSYLYYDFIFVYLICFVFWVLPNILQRFRFKWGHTDGTDYYVYIYPLLDLSMEVMMDFILNHCQYSELYVYQAQLIIIGARIGSLQIIEYDTFTFWFALLLLAFFRINNSSMFITVLIRRNIYYHFPSSLRPVTSMVENSLALKGKHGAYLEHMSWIIFLYFFWIAETTLPNYVKDVVNIYNCEFKTGVWDLIFHWYQPLIVWLIFLLAEYLGILLNKNKKYDNIKWLGGQGYNPIQNVLVRCLGWYMFCLSVVTPLVSSRIADVTN